MQMTDDPDVIAKRDPKVTAPWFASFESEDSCQYLVFVEGNVLTQYNYFSKALLLWFCSHYVPQSSVCGTGGSLFLSGVHF